jgi:IstB-like ATP binding protein
MEGWEIARKDRVSLGNGIRDENLTTALLDRLSHHAHILTTRGDSFRSQRATKAAASGAKKEAHADDSETR